MSPRTTNEKAEATRAMQLATNRRRGFIRRSPERAHLARTGEGVGNSRELFLDNRVAADLPGGTHPRSRARPRTGREGPARLGGRGGPGLVRFLRYTWAAPTT